MNVSTSVRASRNGAAVSAHVVLVTPELAEQWLNRNPNNRRIVQARVSFYASQMQSGSWELTHQGIAFDEHGNLVDGQHRLAAVIASGVATRFWVFSGVSRKSMIAIDVGKSRTADDAFVLLGDEATRASVAIARILLGSYVFQRGTTEKLDIAYTIGLDKLRVFHDAMRDAIAFSAMQVHEKGLRHACVSAAIASAWFTQNRELISQFKDQFAAGVITSEADLAAIKLRNFMLTSNKTRGGREARADLFLRACTALRAYIERRPIAKLYASTEAVFAIPDVAGC
jgi:hypothetical protein